jgi:hypothetical protein
VLIRSLAGMARLGNQALTSILTILIHAAASLPPNHHGPPPSTSTPRARMCTVLDSAKPQNLCQGINNFRRSEEHRKAKSISTGPHYETRPREGKRSTWIHGEFHNWTPSAGKGGCGSKRGMSREIAQTCEVNKAVGPLIPVSINRDRSGEVLVLSSSNSVALDK